MSSTTRSLRRHSASCSSCCRKIDGPHDALTLPGPVPAPDAVSLELLALAARANRAEMDARRVKAELRRQTGSRRRAMRTFVDLTAVRLRRSSARH